MNVIGIEWDRSLGCLSSSGRAYARCVEMRRVRGMVLCQRVGGKSDGSMLHYRRAEGKIVRCGALVKREVTVVCQVVKMAITRGNTFLTHGEYNITAHEMALVVGNSIRVSRSIHSVHVAIRRSC